MGHAFAGVEREVFRVAGFVCYVDKAAVRQVVPRRARGVNGPEVVEHVCVHFEAVAGFGVDLPHPNLIGFGYECVADLAVVSALGEFPREVERGRHASISVQNTTSVAQSIGIEGLE